MTEPFGTSWKKCGLTNNELCGCGNIQKVSHVIYHFYHLTTLDVVYNAYILLTGWLHMNVGPKILNDCDVWYTTTLNINPKPTRFMVRVGVLFSVTCVVQVTCWQVESDAIVVTSSNNLLPWYRTQRRVFSRFLKVATVSELMTFSGSEFQMLGAMTEKARPAKTVRVRGKASLGAWLERSDQERVCGASRYCRYAGVDVCLVVEIRCFDSVNTCRRCELRQLHEKWLQRHPLQVLGVLRLRPLLSMLRSKAGHISSQGRPCNAVPSHQVRHRSVACNSLLGINGG